MEFDGLCFFYREKQKWLLLITAQAAIANR